MGFAVEPVRHSGAGLLLESYKDFAHIFIGGVGAAILIEGKFWQHLLFWSLCAVEVGVAVGSRL